MLMGINGILYIPSLFPRRLRFRTLGIRQDVKPL